MLASGESFLPPHVRATCFDLVVGSQPLASRAFASQSILLFSVSTAPSHQSRESLPSISFFVSFLHLGHRPSNPGSLRDLLSSRIACSGPPKLNAVALYKKIISKVIGWGTNIQTNAFTNTHTQGAYSLSHTSIQLWKNKSTHRQQQHWIFLLFFFFVRLSVCLSPPNLTPHTPINSFTYTHLHKFLFMYVLNNATTHVLPPFNKCSCQVDMFSLLSFVDSFHLSFLITIFKEWTTVYSSLCVRGLVQQVSFTTHQLRYRSPPVTCFATCFSLWNDSVVTPDKAALLSLLIQRNALLKQCR